MVYWNIRWFIIHATTINDEEEPKEGTLIKILTLNKLLNKLPVLLAHIKLEIIQKTKKRNQENSACTLSTR